jgi:lipoyl(octanoyl) transferase
VIALGMLPYDQAWALQKRVVAARERGLIPDTLLLTEHPHTYTLGTAGRATNILLSPEALDARGISVHRVDRGGDVTYHGPGQLVGYPILALPRAGDGLHADVVAYVRLLEQMLIIALGRFGVGAGVLTGYTGVWVEHRGAIGVRVTARRVTLHGFALNVTTDLSYFAGIVPCGIADKAVTSLEVLLGVRLTLTQVAAAVTDAFGAVFARRLYQGDASALAALPSDGG